MTFLKNTKEKNAPILYLTVFAVLPFKVVLTLTLVADTSSVI